MNIICPEWACGAFLEQFSPGNAEVLAILDRASPVQCDLDAGFVIPADTGVEFSDELLHHGCSTLA